MGTQSSDFVSTSGLSKDPPSLSLLLAPLDLGRVQDDSPDAFVQYARECSSLYCSVHSVAATDGTDGRGRRDGRGGAEWRSVSSDPPGDLEVDSCEETIFSSAFACGECTRAAIALVLLASSTAFRDGARGLLLSIADVVCLGGGLFIAATAISFRSFRIPMVRLSEILNSVNVAAPGSAYTCVYKTRL